MGSWSEANRAVRRRVDPHDPTAKTPVCLALSQSCALEQIASGSPGFSPQSWALSNFPSFSISSAELDLGSYLCRRFLSSSITEVAPGAQKVASATGSQQPLAPNRTLGSFGCHCGVMVYTRALEDMAEGSGMDDPAVTLQPFVHQVGGHTRMLLLDSATVCKPLIVRELNFYRNIPPEIKPFTPGFKGVIQVSMMRDNDFLTLRNVSPSCSKKVPESKPKSKSVKKCLSVKFIPEESTRLIDKCETSRSENPNESYFLLLENVASKFFRPCILDLKMGTRQHGDDAPEEKRHRHIDKCKRSTSASLGVRLCGMQVYQADLGMYLFKDKYYGRRLDEDGFKQSLNDFFHNGFKMRTQVICKVIEKLRRLRQTLEKHNSFRFYSSSLLVLYEGCCNEEPGHCGGSCCDSETECSGSWDLAPEEAHHAPAPGPDVLDDKSNDSVAESCADLESSMDCGYRPAPVYKHGDAEVDVRMIDFAHTTYEGYMGDSTVHRGPDNGYLLGLDNLCRLLQDVLAESEHVK